LPGDRLNVGDYWANSSYGCAFGVKESEDAEGVVAKG